MCESRLKRTKITTNKSMSTASFPNCKSLKPTTSLALYWKWIILQVFSYILVTTLKNEITLKLNFEMMCFSAADSLFILFYSIKELIQLYIKYLV
jgi:hypothetical protein